MDQTSLRRTNLSRTLSFLRDHGPRPRAGIAASTGLHKATVSSLIDELLERRLVMETGLAHSGVAGRPGRVVALDGASVGALGLEINVDYIAVHGADLAGRVLVERRISYDAMGSGPDKCLSMLTEVARHAITEMAAAGATVVGVSVAVPGLIDVSRGVVVYAPNLGWRHVPVATRLAGELRADLPSNLRNVDIPVLVGNDANLAAVAEYRSGIAAGTADLVYLTGEVGVGGGVIVDGSLLRGADGFSGEVGHLPVDPSGRLCGCGRTGCWETKVGLAELIRAVTPDSAYGMDTGPVRDPEERLAQVQERLTAGDQTALDAVAEVGKWLGLGGAILVNLFNPRVIVLGGYFATLADLLIPAAEAELIRLVVAGAQARCRFVASDLGFTAASRGAAGVIVDLVFADPTSVGGSPAPVPHGGPAAPQ